MVMCVHLIDDYLSLIWMVLEAVWGSWKDESLVAYENFFRREHFRVDIFIDQNYAAELNGETGLAARQWQKEFFGWGGNLSK